MPDLSIYSSPYYTKGRVKYSSNEFCYFSFTKKGRIIIYFPKGERGETTFSFPFPRLKIFNYEFHFRARFFARGIPPTEHPPRSILRGQRILSLSVPERYTVEDIFRACFHGWLGNRKHLASFVDGFPRILFPAVRIYRNLHLSERISLFLRRALHSKISLLWLPLRMSFFTGLLKSAYRLPLPACITDFVIS